MPLPDVGPHDVQTAVSAHQHVLLGRAQRLARPSVGRQRAARHGAREGQGRRACNHSHNTLSHSHPSSLPLPTWGSHQLPAVQPAGSTYHTHHASFRLVHSTIENRPCGLPTAALYHNCSSMPSVQATASNVRDAKY